MERKTDNHSGVFRGQQRARVDCLKVAERKIIGDVHKFNHSALAWPSLQYGCEVKNEARMKEALIEVPARRREHG